MCKEETGHREDHLNLWGGAVSRAPAGVAGLKLKRGMCTEETGRREDHLNLWSEAASRAPAGVAGLKRMCDRPTASPSLTPAPSVQNARLLLAVSSTPDRHAVSVWGGLTYSSSATSVATLSGHLRQSSRGG